MFINQIQARKTDTDSSCDNSADLTGDQVQPKSTIVVLIKKKGPWRFHTEQEFGMPNHNSALLC